MWQVLIAVLLLLPLSPSLAETIAGRVIAVKDGDTISVLDMNSVPHNIRLAGIDAPERHQPFGSQSKQALSDLVFGKYVLIDAEKRDRYGRLVGKVLINGMDVNLTQVENGLAWHYKAYEHEQSISDRLLYTAAEHGARASARGLWRETDPVPPWTYRKAR